MKRIRPARERISGKIFFVSPADSDLHVPYDRYPVEVSDAVIGRKKKDGKNKNKGSLVAKRERERERDSKRDEMKTEERQTGGRERLSQNDELNDVFVFSRGDSQHPGDERDSTLFLAPCLYFLFLRSRSTTSPLRRVLCSSLCSSFRFCLLVYPSTG